MNGVDAIAGRNRAARFALVIAILSLSLAIGGVEWQSNAHAQDTPSPQSFPTVPTPDRCDVVSRQSPIWDGVPNLDSDIALVSVDGPFRPPTGDAVDDEVLTALIDTIVTSVACVNAGDLGRMLALFSENGVRAFFTGPRGFDPERVDTRIAAGPELLPRDEWLGVMNVRDAVSLPDGRVGAIVETASPNAQPVGVKTPVFLDFVYFAFGPTPDGTERWLIDDSVAIDASTQVVDCCIEIP